MNAEQLHLEVTVSGVNRDALAEIVGSLWRSVDFLFPIVTGEWDFMRAVVVGGVIGTLAVMTRLVLHLADDGDFGRLPEAAVASPYTPDQRLQALEKAARRPAHGWQASYRSTHRRTPREQRHPSGTFPCRISPGASSS